MSLIVIGFVVFVNHTNQPGSTDPHKTILAVPTGQEMYRQWAACEPLFGLDACSSGCKQAANKSTAKYGNPDWPWGAFGGFIKETITSPPG